MTQPQPLLLAPVIRTPRPFLVLRNVDPNTNLVLMLETLQRHDTESEALAHAHGMPTTSILADTNHVIHVPASLFPAPRPDQRRPRQPPPTPTSTYVLIPRAGTRVTLPTILSALGQGEPNGTPYHQKSSVTSTSSHLHVECLPLPQAISPTSFFFF